MIISLIGMMGSGKSTIAKLLVDRLCFQLVDTDSLIVEKENLSINDIFENKGEEYFRKLESKILSDVLSIDNSVISTGGGIVKNESNILLLKEKSIVFYLKADENVLYERVKANNERPLLHTDDIFSKIKILLSERKEKYELAHYVIDANQEPNKIVDEIIEKLS